MTDKQDLTVPKWISRVGLQSNQLPLILTSMSSFIAGTGKEDADSNVSFWEKTIFT